MNVTLDALVLFTRTEIVHLLYNGWDKAGMQVSR